MTPFAFVVVALASYRAARIVTRDSISEPFRGWVYRWAWVSEDQPRAPWRTYVYEVLSCVLCLSVWCAALGYVAWVNWSWSHPVLFVLAIAGLAAAVATWERD